MKFKTAEAMWEAYKEDNNNVPDTYDAWAFGDSKEMADELAGLVLAGSKTATASNHLLYELENEELSYDGLYNIILDGEGCAVAIVETTSVVVVPFDEVTAEHAYKEGEGDRSLSYWRRVHEDFFKREFAETETEFHHKIPVVCETFRVVYK